MNSNQRTLWIVALAFCLILCRGAAAQTITSHLPLRNIIERIEEAYPDVIKYDSKIQAYELRSKGAQAWMPPTFSIGADRFPYDLSMLNEQSPMNQASIMLSLTQMIPNPSKLSAKSDYFKSLQKVQSQKKEWTKNELRTLAKKLYYRRYISERLLHVIGENEELLMLLISSAESRYSFNQASLPSIYKAKAKLEEIRNMRLVEETMIVSATIGINTLLLRDINTQFTIDTLIGVTRYTTAIIADTIQRSDIGAMRSMINADLLEREYMSRESRPDFGVEFRHMQMFGMPNQFSLMGMITIPVVPWSSDMYTSGVGAVESEIQYSEKEVEGMSLMAKRMAAEKLSMLTYMSRQLDNYDQNVVPAFERNLDVTLSSFKQNTIEFFNVIDAWEMLLMKRTERLSLLQGILQLQAEFEYEVELK